MGDVKKALSILQHDNMCFDEYFFRGKDQGIHSGAQKMNYFCSAREVKCIILTYKILKSLQHWTIYVWSSVWYKECRSILSLKTFATDWALARATCSVCYKYDGRAFSSEIRTITTHRNASVEQNYLTLPYNAWTFFSTEKIIWVDLGAYSMGKNGKKIPRPFAL